MYNFWCRQFEFVVQLVIDALCPLRKYDYDDDTDVFLSLVNLVKICRLPLRS